MKKISKEQIIELHYILEWYDNEIRILQLKKDQCFIDSNITKSNYYYRIKKIF